MNECTACQTIKAFGSFRLSGLAFWRQSFVSNGRIIFFYQTTSYSNSYTRTYISGPKAKINTRCNVHAMNLSDWMDLGLFRSNK